MPRPLILVTNDDSYQAPGIHALTEAMREIGDVVVVAPDQPQSGMGHAITIKFPLHFKKLHEEEGLKIYSSNGTPVDCVKLAIHKLLDRKPDLVVSGINHGSNSSINIIYSGTMAAVLEARMGGIPAIGFSIHDYSLDADFSKAKHWVVEIAKKVLEKGLPWDVSLNVNFPKLNDTDYKGIKVCTQAKSYWKEDFEERLDPRNGKPYYWLTGTFSVLEENENSDEWALNHYYISVVPVKFDFTSYESINHVNEILS